MSSLLRRLLFGGSTRLRDHERRVLDCFSQALPDEVHKRLEAQLGALRVVGARPLVGGQVHRPLVEPHPHAGAAGRANREQTVGREAGRGRACPMPPKVHR